MFTKRPRRLDAVSYVGFRRYFLTICTAFRRPHFSAASIVDAVLLHLRQTSTLFDFELIAYCFMPDHLHVLVAASSERADFSEFVKRFKQLTGFAFRKERCESLWQPGYHERIVRDDESTEAVVRYILANPIRAGLATELGAYPYAGSDVYDSAALLTAWEGQAWQT